LRKQLKQKGVKASVTLFKDYFEKNRQNIENTSFGEFQIQPNMVIEIQEDWKKLDDYLSAMSSKYRVRAKSAFKKAKDIEKQELGLTEIKRYEIQMFELYNQIVESAGFNGIKLQQNYFTNLKEHLNEKFKVIGYFKDGELIGFYTVFFEKEVMESHYLGINQEENRRCQLYINMLYDMIKMGIYHEVKRIFLARTALEIKSSVGAEPHDLFFYLKNHNPIFNALAHRTFDLFNPQEAWTQRRPFK
jgi:predicted N-acyltransferase